MLTLGLKTKSHVRNNQTDHPYSWGSKFIDRHPVFANMVIILIIAILGIYAAYLATALFTKHGRAVRVPGVENMSYTEAISRLHAAGLKVDIRDSVYHSDMKPGYVIEQFPKSHSMVKPGRKIFLYINTVHPKEVILDDDNHPNELAMKGLGERQAVAKLEELDFRKVKVVKVLGTTDRVVKVLADGRPVRKMQKVPVTASIVLEVSDGRLDILQDSLSNIDYLQSRSEGAGSYGGGYDGGSYDSGASDPDYSPDFTPMPDKKPNREPDSEPEPDENSQYF